MTVLKVIVLGLALANVGYFLWFQDIDPAQSPAGVATKTLKLASEVQTPGSPPTASTVPSATAPAATPDSVSTVPANPDTAAQQPSDTAGRCVTVGPFKDVSEASHAATTLRSEGYDPRQRVAEGDVWAGVWVYLPLPAARAAGEQMLSKLKAAGIDDALEMPGPGDGSVISLGLFSEPKRAQSRVAQAQALGFSPGIADRKRTGNVYWIDIDLKAADAMPNAADLQGESGHISRLDVKPCTAPAP